MLPALTHDLIAARLPSRREPERPPARVVDEALRGAMQAALAARPRGRLWVFAYGALMWQHEMPPGFYLAQWVDVAAEPGGAAERRALTFVADPSHPLYAGRVPEAEIAETLARGVGPQGAAATYLLDTAEALRREGMPDLLLERLEGAVGARLTV